MQKQASVETHWRCQEVSHLTKGAKVSFHLSCQVILKLWIWDKEPKRRRREQQASPLKMWELELGKVRLGKERRVGSGHCNPSQSREWTPQSGLGRPCLPYLLQVKFGEQGTASCFFSFWGLIVFRISSSGEQSISKSFGITL